LTVLNHPPALDPPLSSPVTFKYLLNTYSSWIDLPLGSYTPDADGHTVTISYSSSGINRDSTGFYFYPTSLGLKYVVLTLNDGYDYTTYTIYVDIVSSLNTPPVYDSPLSSYTPLSVPLNSIGGIPVPSFHDPDSTPGCCTV
jgi:hypothetical protein